MVDTMVFLHAADGCSCASRDRVRMRWPLACMNRQTHCIVLSALGILLDLLQWALADQRNGGGVVFG